MLAPHELKNKTFTRVVRGYNPVEVDQYFDFLIDKYTELYKLYAEIEQKYNSVNSKYNEISNEEESIRSAILKAQKLGEVIVANAKKEAESFKDDLKDRCDEIVQEAKDKVSAERENIVVLRKSAMQFQDKLCEYYLQHLTAIKEMNLDKMIDPDIVLPQDERFDSAEENILKKAGIETDNSENESENEDAEEIINNKED